uniref:Uncharacterized protein n=1 Tax=Arcella intermedia TaxID=1963864 RepID=A0A6B2L9V6_9EUKA
MKVLILGISGSGKSTFTKQMIVIHQGFSTYEEERYKSILHQNVLIGIQELVKYTDKLELKVSNENRKTARYFIEMIVLEEVLDEKLAQKVKKIWNDPAIQNAWVMAPQMQLQMNNMEYLISNLDRMCLPDYKPSVEDILQARQRTTGQQTTTFTKDKYTWELIDVGGQRPEREKWENIIQHTQLHAVIYFAGLDEYNMNSSEAQGKTKMAISMQVWEEVLHTIEKHQICLLLFLNKMDLFEKKIKNESDFNDFKTILGYSGPQDADECSKFLRDKFLAITQKMEYSEIHAHVICALDTSAITTVFEAVKEDIFMKRLATTQHF